jgi:hypothetical protein
MKLELVLRLGGALHFVILIASALTPRMLDWRHGLAPLHPFLRRLFWVYGVFITMVIAGFGVLALRHAPEMAAGDPAARSLCAFIAIFWGARLFVQFFVFDAKPFLTRWWVTAGYHSLTLAFIYLTGAFAYAATNPLK